MDLTIQVRSIDLLTKFVRHDLKNVPPYGYALQKKALPYAKIESKPLQRALPASQGVPNAAVSKLFSDISRETDELGAHALLIMRNGSVIAEGAWAPFSLDVPHMLYSMSKSFTGTAIGIAVDEGILSLDEPLVSIFPDKTNPASAKLLQKHTVRHLLTMSSGSRFNEVGTMLDGDWAKMFLESIPKFEAGTAFEYNSLNTYMLAAILMKKTGQSLIEYLKPRLFEPLGISSYEWETCPNGVEKGGWGLALLLEDAAKLGQLYLNGGEWEGKRIFSRSWAKAATSAQITSIKGEMKHGYGYQIWVTDEEGSFQFNGAFGQYVLCSPKHNTVIALFSGSAKLFAQGKLSKLVDEFHASFQDEPLKNDALSYDELQNQINNLSFTPSLVWPWGEVEPFGLDAKVFNKLVQKINGCEYRLSENTGGVFPQCIQAVHGNYTLGTEIIRFVATPNGLKIVCYERERRFTLNINADGSVSQSVLTMRGEAQRVGMRAVWAQDEDVFRMTVLCAFIETPNCRILHFEFRDDGLKVAFDELPSVGGALEMLLTLVGTSVVGYIKKLVPVVGKENIDGLMRSFTLPEAHGVLICEE